MSREWTNNATPPDDDDFDIDGDSDYQDTLMQKRRNNY